MESETLTQKTWTVEERAANRREWIKKLRSGEFEQGFGHIACENTYCCIGVAAVVAGWEFHFGRSCIPGYIAAQNYLGLYDDHGASRTGAFKSLFRLNDNERYSFSAIANHFEAHMVDYIDEEDAEYERRLASEGRAS